MERKLVLMGKHTLMSAIPSSWVKQHNLGKGDTIQFQEINNNLLITTNKEIFEKRTIVEIKSSKIEIVWRILQPLYTSGYDEIKILYNDKKTLKLIENSMQYLIGFEIIETNPKYIIIKSISQNLDEEFSAILRRTFLVFKEMSTITKEIFQTQSRERLNEIKPLEFTINKYTMFLKRIINRKNYKYSHYSYLIIYFLELSANHLEYIRRYYDINPKLKIEKNIYNEYKLLDKLIEDIYLMYYKYDEETFYSIALEQPHFKWFNDVKDSEIKLRLKSLCENLVQIARQIQAINIEK